MTRGIVFYLKGYALDFLVPASLYSLLKVYKGPIHVVHRELSENTLKGLQKVPNLTLSLEADNMFSDINSRTGNWCRKAYHHLDGYPFDINMYYDWDHIWFHPIDSAPFDIAAKIGICSTIHPLAPRLQWRKEAMLKGIMGVPLDGPAYRGINGGFVTAVKGHPMIHEWMRRLDKVKTSSTPLNRNPEEFGLTSMCNEVGIADPMKTSLCVDLGRDFIKSQDILYASCAAHGALRRIYYLHAFWSNWHEVYDTNFMGCHDRFGKDRQIKLSYTFWWKHYSSKITILEKQLDDKKSGSIV